MTDKEIEMILASRVLVLGLGYPIVFENDDTDHNGEDYISFRLFPIATVDDTTDGTGEHKTGYALITVATQSGTFATLGRDTAEAIKQALGYGKRLPGTDGTVLIRNPPHIQSGFEADSKWMTPIRIDYAAQQGSI